MEMQQERGWYSVGGVSKMGREFLSLLEKEKITPKIREVSLNEFCNQAIEKPCFVFIENQKKSTESIERIRTSHTSCLLIWFGKEFSKEEYRFALLHRVYSILEEEDWDPIILGKRFLRFEQYLQTIENLQKKMNLFRSLVFQGEEYQGQNKNPIWNEIRKILAKVERIEEVSEFLTQVTKDSKKGIEDFLPVHLSQSFLDMLSLIHEVERTGVLHVIQDEKGKSRVGKLIFSYGKILFAQAEKVQGEKAIYRMATWNFPQFSFERITPSLIMKEKGTLKENVNENWSIIQNNIQKSLSRFSEIEENIPSASLRLRFNSAILTQGEKVKISPQDFLILTSVIEYENVENILNQNSLPDILIYESLICLRKKKVIQVIHSTERVVSGTLGFKL